MRRIGQYISYIIAICLVSFCFIYATLSPGPIIPKISSYGSFFHFPILDSLFNSEPLPTPQAESKADLKEELNSIAPVISNTADLYPQLLSHLVKITNLVTGSSGSGVIIWSGLDNKNVGHTFILTNRHVLPVGNPGTVEIFNYLNFRDIESIQVFPVFSVVQSSTADLALVEIISNELSNKKASFISSLDYEKMPLYTELFIVGCGLGNPPFISSAKVITFDKERLMLNGFSVWGCSGGGVFDNQGRLVSITSQIGMATVGGRDFAITNISISIPVNIICEWLLETNYKFIVNSKLGSLNDIFKPKKYY